MEFGYVRYVFPKMYDRFLMVLECSKGRRMVSLGKYVDIEIIRELATKMRFGLSFRDLGEKVYLEGLFTGT